MTLFFITFDEFRYLQKHYLKFEIQFNLKIIMPEVFNPCRTNVTVFGDEKSKQNFRDLLRQKTGNLAKNRLMGNPVPLITLSDTEDKSPATPKKRKKNKKKRKSSQGAALKDPVIDNVPESKRARRITLLLTGQDFMPTTVTSHFQEARPVQLESVTRAKTNNLLQLVSDSHLPSLSLADNAAAASTSQLADGIVMIEDTVQDKSSSSKEKDDIVILSDDSIVEKVHRPLYNHLYVIDRNSTLLKDSVQNEASTSRNGDDSGIPFNVGAIGPMIVDVPMAVNVPLVVNLTMVNLPNGRRAGNHCRAVDHRRVNNHCKAANAHRTVNASLAVNAHRVADVAIVPQPVAMCRLRPIVIDGNNIARTHGNTGENKIFSCRGIQISVEFFLTRGHKVTVFVPKFRRHWTSGKCRTTNPHILDELEKNKRLIYTPTRYLNGSLVQCYDDRFIVQCASKNGGVILSNDNYKDIMDESESFRTTISERLLMYCFDGDSLMIPVDPLGRSGPFLDQFLAFPE